MTAVPTVAGFFDPATHTVSYIVSDPVTRRAAVIDPVLDFTPNNARTATRSADALLAHLAQHELQLDWILDTHAHADHLSAAQYLRGKTGAQVAIGAGITTIQRTFGTLFGLDDLAFDGSQFDRLVGEGDTLPLGSLTIEVLHTPGHTPACVSFRIGDALFVGDTLFMPDYGTARCDFPGGSAATLYASIRKLLALPGETRIFVGHDYLPAGRSEIAWETSVAEQRRANVHIHEGVSEADFVAMRQARDATLDAPQLILPSLQVNIRAGQLPPAEANGTRYLKLPLDAI
ncbi:glyoxylase-like metal-dependent hydrolase (beta-lactamase superfamily II) [Novosphingobium kunmingense]|uniref:Glyoxylase-like metal-dependent hydrolase (Beta-lactamase superfamily II) n=1 Tax=Novosphingobium kunmingense TaxID=1211806 RepID=A0A2N0HJL3_9SPHN|nr:MBL fold metallo-hydrolase [Novosphingobium kunmingense]PKB19130.1 glyoxylase-like metal-dependent hydrolase (beta-lactamase superfamily II) [Novosphingobium kunmingense]